jgi:hypothetical protein
MRPVLLTRLNPRLLAADDEPHQQIGRLYSHANGSSRLKRMPFGRLGLVVLIVLAAISSGRPAHAPIPESIERMMRRQGPGAIQSRRMRMGWSLP